jgi:hypothetical protein
MVRYVGRALRTWRVVFGCVVLAALAAGGWGIANRSSSSAHANASAHPSTTKTTAAPSDACAQTALGALGDVAQRVYREGVSSERTASALSLIRHSAPLREAVERNDPQAARVAARALLATGHMTNLTVTRGGTAGQSGPAGRTGPAGRSGTAGAGGQTLAVVGMPGALAPLHGTLTNSNGATIGSFVASVWANSGFLDETDGIAEGSVVLRAAGAPVGGTSAAGSLALPPGKLPSTQGALDVHGVAYRYTSFPASAYPSGSPLRVYLLRSLRSIAPLCGATQDDTVVNTLSHVATLIYAAEVGRSTRPQIARVQHNRALLTAVAHAEPEATRLAIDNLLNEHIVRLRVLDASGKLISDVGGPYVLAPVRAPLRLHGRTIGSFVLSIQDDMGYRLLAQRLAGLDVVMYRGSQVVMSSFSPPPAHVPASGTFSYKSAIYRAFTFMAEAFPSGPLRITDLIPIPYVLGPIAHAAPAADPRLLPRVPDRRRQRCRSTAPPCLPKKAAQACASERCLSRNALSSFSKELANFSTPSRSSVSVTSS